MTDASGDAMLPTTAPASASASAGSVSDASAAGGAGGGPSWNAESSESELHAAMMALATNAGMVLLTWLLTMTSRTGQPHMKADEGPPGARALRLPMEADDAASSTDALRLGVGLGRRSLAVDGDTGRSVALALRSGRDDDAAVDNRPLHDYAACDPPEIAAGARCAPTVRIGPSGASRRGPSRSICARW